MSKRIFERNIKIDENIKKELDKIKSKKFTTMNGVLRLLIDNYYNLARWHACLSSAGL